MRSLRFIGLPLVLTGLSLIAAPSWANVKEIKLYKQAFPDAEKPKCIGCHAVEKPKKEGNHDLNEYGQKIKPAAEELTVEDLKKVGPIQ